MAFGRLTRARHKREQDLIDARILGLKEAGNAEILKLQRQIKVGIANGNDVTDLKGELKNFQRMKEKGSLDEFMDVTSKTSFMRDQMFALTEQVKLGKMKNDMLQFQRGMAQDVERKVNARISPLFSDDYAKTPNGTFDINAIGGAYRNELNASNPENASAAHAGYLNAYNLFIGNQKSYNENQIKINQQAITEQEKIKTEATIERGKATTTETIKRAKADPWPVSTTKTWPADIKERADLHYGRTGERLEVYKLKPTFGGGLLSAFPGGKSLNFFQEETYDFTRAKEEGRLDDWKNEQRKFNEASGSNFRNNINDSVRGFNSNNKKNNEIRVKRKSDGIVGFIETSEYEANKILYEVK